MINLFSFVVYYQWVPFVLGLQCVLFYLPRIIWQMICYNRTGTDLYHLTLASQAVHANADKREELVTHLAQSLEQLLFQVSVYNFYDKVPCKRSGRCCLGTAYRAQLLEENV